MRRAGYVVNEQDGKEDSSAHAGFVNVDRRRVRDSLLDE
jgi:hypothetical protein